MTGGKYHTSIFVVVYLYRTNNVSEAKDECETIGKGCIFWYIREHFIC
jgi:hypothetical protein